MHGKNKNVDVELLMCEFRAHYGGVRVCSKYGNSIEGHEYSNDSILFYVGEPIVKCRSGLFRL